MQLQNILMNFMRKPFQTVMQLKQSDCGILMCWRRQNYKSSYAAVIPLWITSLLNKEQAIINGDGETSRDFCYVENAVQANLLSATTFNKDAINTVYNVAVGQQTSLKKLYEIICQTLNLDMKPFYNEFRKGDIRHSLANVNKAKDLLGYEAMYDIKKGINEMIDWYCKNVINDKNT